MHKSIFLFVATCLCGELIKLGANNEISFQANRSDEFIDIYISTKIKNGWVSVGIGKSMANAHVWMLSKFSQTNWTFELRKSSGYFLPKLELEQPLARVYNGQVQFRQPNHLFGTSQSYIYALYEGDSREMHTQRGIFLYDIDAKTNSSSFDLFKLHGVIMSVCWLFLSYVGVFVSRFLKLIVPQWFKYHFWIFLITGLLTLIAFGISFYGKDVHFNTLHGKLGLFVVVAMASQISLGIFIDKTFDPDRSGIPLRDKMHWILGFFVCVLGTSNVFLGQNYYESFGWKFFSAVLVGIILTVFFVVNRKIGQQHEVFQPLIHAGEDSVSSLDAMD